MYEFRYNRVRYKSTIDCNFFAECWVYKRRGENYRTLPRREDISQNKPYDYEKNLGTPDYFPEKLDGAPPKLWLAWIYKPHFRDERRWVKDDVKYLFGDDYKVSNNFKDFPVTRKCSNRAPELYYFD